MTRHTLSSLETSQKAILLESVLENIADGIMLVNGQGEFLLVNDAAKKMLGVSEVSKNWANWSEAFGCFQVDGLTVFPPEELPLVKALSGVATDGVEMVIKNTAIESPICISVSGRAMPSESGMTGGAVIVFRDITEKRRTETELKLANEGLKQFAYIAAHDLQEPLRTVMSYLDLLAPRCQSLDEKAQKYLDKSVKGAQRMQALIADLLAYCRFSTNPQQFQKLDMNTVVNQAVDELNSLLVETGATLNVGSLPSILGDNSQLIQLFQNLISNAVKYRSEQAPIINISAVKQGTIWLFEISDNGIGIDMKYGERIFLIFQRLHARHEYSGTGIGLAICKRIVERHGGKIWVSSAENAGSKFHFTVPVVDREGLE